MPVLARSAAYAVGEDLRWRVGLNSDPIMFLMMLMTQNTRVMGEFTLNTRQKTLGWPATAAMLAAAVGLFTTWGH